MAPWKDKAPPDLHLPPSQPNLVVASRRRLKSRYKLLLQTDHATTTSKRLFTNMSLTARKAKVNEDASGDISALQWQIQQLKGQLSFLTKNKFFPPLASNLEPNSDSCRLSEVSEEHNSTGERGTADHKLLTPNKEIKRMKAALVGALRREKMAETTIQGLKVEIDRTKCLAQQKDEDAQHNSIKLMHCEEKIKQLELLVDGQLSVEKYLMEENRALKEEIQFLKMKIDKNSESSKLALENDRLLQQLEIFQNFYEHGERERLLAELSELRDQLLVHLQEKFTFSMKNENQDIDATQELEVCQNMNSKLLREADKLQTELGKYLNYNKVKSNSILRSSFKHPDELLTTDNRSLDLKARVNLVIPFFQLPLSLWAMLLDPSNG
ncbi:unnamed protein product [Trifolium pratense]|uniref:Uncharacterized protein n=1 Tax=Trifolium pratense TaxID=57577 RepID=A0ACB0K4M0_TRIPR|nr:unnamed protein product [Trifolium pratense]